MECWRKKKKNKEKKKKKREKYYQRNGHASEEVERWRAKGRWMNVELSERDKDTDTHERRERINELRYNKEYERYMTEEIQEYLARERKMMGRFSCGNEEREHRYWIEEEERRCRMRREKERESSTCEMDVKEREEILNENGKEIGWMKEIWKKGEKEREGERWEIGIRKVFLKTENTSIGRKERKTE
jgi:hypothetical protein